MEKPIYIIGDNHGKYDSLFNNLDKYDIKDCTLIHAGDGGEGFIHPEKQLRQFELLNNRFKKRGINYLSIRGNHSDPAYFKGQIALSNFELLPDYTIRELNGEKFLFVGGAVSIDRVYRKQDISYWSDELFVFDESKAVKCDVLITHSAPTYIGPVDKEGIAHWCNKDAILWDDCLTERKLHDKLFSVAKPKRSYHGHFHLYTQVEHNGCVSTILDELQIVEHRDYKELN